MKRIYSVLLTSLFLILIPYSLRSASLPDSLLTEDAVYEYTFTDFPLAQQIMDELRLRKSLPDYRLDMTEGDLYFNNGYYYQALKYYTRALENDSVREVDERYMSQLHRLISCYDGLHNESKKMEYIKKLQEKAKAVGDKAMEAVAMFNMGKSLFYQGQENEGLRLMEMATERMAESDYKYKFDNLRYNYNTLIIFYERQERNEDALRCIDMLEKVVGQALDAGSRMEGLTEKEQKAVFAHRAVVLQRLGRTMEAREYYEKFLALSRENSRDDYLIMPYLFDCGKYDEIIRMNTLREKFLKEQGDTINYHMTTIIKSLGMAYRDVGNYAESSRYFERLSVLRDSIKNREQESAALELAMVYDMNAKDLRIQEQAVRMERHLVVIALLLCVGALLGVLLFLFIRHNRVIEKKNVAMANMIKELQKKNEELFRKQEENIELRKQCNLEDCLEETENIPEKDFPAEESDSEKKNEADRKLFERIEQEIISRQLFLNPSFSREELLKIIYIPKNKFANLFRTYAGVSFPDYINNLRLMYAVKLIQKHTNYTINAIAETCGMSSRTFHRLFLKKFGVTPAEFREELKKEGNKDSEDKPSET